MFIFEKHNEAIIPWDSISKVLVNKPALLTFDYHTDTHLALLRSTYKRLNGAEHTIIKEEVNRILSRPFNINDMLKELRNDEQIDFAIQTNIISHAYVISHQTNTFTIRSEEEKRWFAEKYKIESRINGFNIPKPKSINYIFPENKIFELDNDNFHDDLEVYDEKKIRSLALEDRNLEYKMLKIKEINKSIFGKNYNFRENFILDIDLDYFNTLDSINPKSINIFYSLIRESKAITIARESYFVNDCKLENEKIDVNYLLKRLIEHIKIACSS